MVDTSLSALMGPAPFYRALFPSGSYRARFVVRPPPLELPSTASRRPGALCVDDSSREGLFRLDDGELLFLLYGMCDYYVSGAVVYCKRCNTCKSIAFSSSRTAARACSALLMVHGAHTIPARWQPTTGSPFG